MTKRRTQYSVGMTRIRLAKMLTDMGYPIAPEDLHPAQGRNRSGGLDVYAWEGFGIFDNGLGFVISSFSTMTELLRTGIIVDCGGCATVLEAHPMYGGRGE